MKQLRQVYSLYVAFAEVYCHEGFRKSKGCSQRRRKACLGARGITAVVRNPTITTDQPGGAAISCGQWCSAYSDASSCSLVIHAARQDTRGDDDCFKYLGQLSFYHVCTACRTKSSQLRGVTVHWNIACLCGFRSTFPQSGEIGWSVLR